MRQSGGLISQKQAMLKYVNENLSQQLEQTIKEMESIGDYFYERWRETGKPYYRDMSTFLKARREMFGKYGIEALNFTVDLVPDESQAGVSIELKELALPELLKERIEKEKGGE
jgi:hypothetical protein